MATTNASRIISPPLLGQHCELDEFACPQDAAPSMSNFVRVNGVIQLRPGVVALGSSLDTNINNIIRYRTHTGILTTVIATLQKLYTWDTVGFDWIDISDPGDPLGGTDYSPTLFRVFPKSNKNYVIGVNPANAPIAWDSESAAYTAVGGSPPTAKCIAVCNNRVILGNLGNGKETEVDVSAFNDFEDGWGAVQTVKLSDTPGAIVEMRELGMLTVAVYKEDSIYVCQAQASLEPFTFELKAAGIEGPVSSLAVLTLPNNKHLFLTQQGDVMQFDGINLSSTGANIRAAISTSAHIPRLGLSRAFYNAATRTANFIIPTDDDDNMTQLIAIDIDDFSVWPIKYPSAMNVCACSTIVLEQNIRIGDLVEALGTYLLPLSEWGIAYLDVLICDGDQALEIQGHTDLGEAISGHIETPMVLPLAEEPQRLTDIQEIIPLYAGTPTTATLKIKKSLYGEDPVFGSARSFAAAHTVGYDKETVRWVGVRLDVSSSSEFKYRGQIVSGTARGYK